MGRSVSLWLPDRVLLLFSCRQLCTVQFFSGCSYLSHNAGFDLINIVSRDAKRFCNRFRRFAVGRASENFAVPYAYGLIIENFANGTLGDALELVAFGRAFPCFGQQIKRRLENRGFGYKCG